MAGAFCVERGVFMYPVSEAFLRAVQENTRRYYWTGKITTKGGAVYPFGYGEKVKAYLRRGARPLQESAEYPNPQVGYGSICVENSLPM